MRKATVYGKEAPLLVRYLLAGMRAPEGWRVDHIEKADAIKEVIAACPVDDLDKPIACPVCLGDKAVLFKFKPPLRTCPACRGKGWTSTAHLCNVFKGDK